jgi:hypothetical protein
MGGIDRGEKLHQGPRLRVDGLEGREIWSSLIAGNLAGHVE